jgi:hypothetical protein
MYAPDCSEMATALGGEEKHRGPAKARGSPAFFPLRCERKRRHWLAADHGKWAYPLRGGATRRSRVDWWHWGRS